MSSYTQLDPVDCVLLFGIPNSIIAKEKVEGFCFSSVTTSNIRAFLKVDLIGYVKKDGKWVKKRFLIEGYFYGPGSERITKREEFDV